MNDLQHNVIFLKDAPTQLLISQIFKANFFKYFFM